MKERPLNWAWAPAAVFWIALNWTRFGPVLAITNAAAGVAVGLWGKLPLEPSAPGNTGRVR